MDLPQCPSSSSKPVPSTRPPKVVFFPDIIGHLSTVRPLPPCSRIAVHLLKRCIWTLPTFTSSTFISCQEVWSSFFGFRICGLGCILGLRIREGGVRLLGSWYRILFQGLVVDLFMVVGRVRCFQAVLIWPH